MISKGSHFLEINKKANVFNKLEKNSMISTVFFSTIVIGVYMKISPGKNLIDDGINSIFLYCVLIKKGPAVSLLLKAAAAKKFLS